MFEHEFCPMCGANSPCDCLYEKKVSPLTRRKPNNNNHILASTAMKYNENPREGNINADTI